MWATGCKRDSAGTPLPRWVIGAKTALRGRGLSRGFTLLELMVVLVLATLVLAIVGPAIGRATGLELRAATRDIAAGLRSARGAAIAGQREITFDLDLDAKIWSISSDSRTHDLPADTEIRLVTADTELAGERRGAIRFFPDGSASGGRITLGGEGGGYEVDVHWLTGQVKILD